MRKKRQIDENFADSDDTDDDFGRLGICLLAACAAFFALNCGFSCAERAQMAKINTWRSSQGLDSITTMGAK